MLPFFPFLSSVTPMQSFHFTTVCIGQEAQEGQGHGNAESCRKCRGHGHVQEMTNAWFGPWPLPAAALRLLGARRRSSSNNDWFSNILGTKQTRSRILDSPLLYISIQLNSCFWTQAIRSYAQPRKQEEEARSAAVRLHGFFQANAACGGCRDRPHRLPPRARLRHGSRRGRQPWLDARVRLRRLGREQAVHSRRHTRYGTRS